MIAVTTSFKSRNQLQRHYLTIAAKIDTHARITFRDVRCLAQREDAVQECLALGWRWFLRLHERGKDIRRFTMVFVFLVVKAVKSGRRLVGMVKAKDVLNERCQRKHGFKVKSLSILSDPALDPRRMKPHGQEMLDVFAERLLDNLVTPIPDQVAFRMDWPRFFMALPTRDRKMAEFLSLGHSNKSAAAKFNLSPGRVTQLRQRWCKEWKRCQDPGVVR